MSAMENNVNELRSKKTNQPRGGSMDSQKNASSLGVFSLRDQDEESPQDEHQLGQEDLDG